MTYIGGPSGFDQSLGEPTRRAMLDLSRRIDTVPAGADGKGWTGGSYNAGTGVVTFTSTDGLGFVTGDLRGSASDPLLLADGSAGAPTYSFSSDPNTGVYRVGTNTIGFATDGAALFRMDSSALRGNVNYTPSMPGKTAGSAAAPAYSFVGDTNTGMYRDAADSISFATGGVQRLDVDGGGIKGKVAFQALLGSAAAPGFAFDGDTNTGMYRRTTDDIGFATGGVERVSIRANGYMYAGWLNTVSGSTTATPSRIYCNGGGSDAFVRYLTLQNFRSKVADQTVFCSPPTRAFNYSGTRNQNGQYSYTFAATIGGVSLSGAKAVIVNLAVRSSGNAYFVAWKYGESLPGISLANLVPNVFSNVQATIPIDSSRRIRYMYGAAAGNYTIFDVIGVVF